VGIRPADVPGFLGAQVLGAATATLVVRWLVSPVPMPTVGPAPEATVGGTRPVMPAMGRPGEE
jgi:hypothetical protein